MKVWKLRISGDHKAFVRIDEHGNEIRDPRSDYLDKCDEPKKEC